MVLFIIFIIPTDHGIKNFIHIGQSRFFGKVAQIAPIVETWDGLKNEDDKNAKRKKRVGVDIKQ
jgi:hypothetical protein